MIKASEFCVSVFDGTHESPKPTKEGYKLLTSKNILNGYIDSSDAYFISEQDYNSINERSKIYKWDILFSMIGTVGNICLITEEKLDFAIKNMGVFSTRNEEKAKWLYFYLKSPIVKRKIQNQLNGAVQKFLPLGWLRNLELPEYKEDHKRIVDLLWSIEEKINKNNSINLELESMTKTIYDYWFLQFEFPNEEGKPYKSSGGKMVWNEELKCEIPDGWGVIKYKDIGITVTGKEDANFAKENGKYAYFTCGSSILRCNEYKFDGKALLIAGNGEFNVKYYDGKFNAYQRTYVLMPNKKYIGLLYQVVLREINYFKKGSNGSIVKFITKGDIENIEFLLPNDVNLLKPLNLYLDLIQQYNQQNQELISLRDFLLPLLMNGQITFKGLDS